MGPESAVNLRILMRPRASRDSTVLADADNCVAGPIPTVELVQNDSKNVILASPEVEDMYVHILCWMNRTKAEPAMTNKIMNPICGSSRRRRTHRSFWATLPPKPGRQNPAVQAANTLMPHPRHLTAAHTELSYRTHLPSLPTLCRVAPPLFLSSYLLLCANVCASAI